MHLLIEFSATSSCSDISIVGKHNNQIIYNQPLSIRMPNLSYDIDNLEHKHQIQLIMSNKQPCHTVVDSQNQIVADSSMCVDSICFDTIDVTNLFCQGQAGYTHNFNGTKPLFTDEFFGVMGCNGTVNINFYTPIHVWFLDHLHQ